MLEELPAHELRERLSLAIDPYVDSNPAAGVVVAVIRGDQQSVLGFGKLLSDDDAVSVDSALLEIGSITKVFTAILLAEMAARGEVNLDDPIRKHLPESVRVPRRGKREITLEDLATHRSGLPRLPANLNPKDMANPYVDYTVEELYSYLSECRLTREPASAYEYSNLGAGLLGHILERVADRPFEELVTERICRRLGMYDTLIRLDSERQRRLTGGHDESGQPARNWDSDTLAGAGALRSTGRDMLVFLAANLGASGLEPGDPLALAIDRCQQPRASRNPPRPTVWRRYGVVAICVLLSLMVQSWWHIEPGRFAFAVAALAPSVLAALHGGLIPGLLATALTVLGTWQLWRDHFGWSRTLIMGAFLSFSLTPGEWLRRAGSERVGLGWHFDRFGLSGPHYRWHNGGTGGYASFAALIKETRVAVCVLSSSASSVDDAAVELLLSMSR
jgi:CubicO group peptidase (beta-lactamase class C family)